MLFTRISFTALLLFVATVSSAPLNKPAAAVRLHADHPFEGLNPPIPHVSKTHLFENLAANQGAPGAIGLARTASHIQVHAAMASSLEIPTDPPMQRYARSPPSAHEAMEIKQRMMKLSNHLKSAFHAHA
ncbi:hypothetical protein HYPSUDRAFT_1041185 [Hypholoma sublateritium FD-334 SS-4]|uniref:Uncharacterized protein n=1 Tax=Hypholoma sublateritium (strain FD-334 SS-4) TaxID=945553 RepID=A0A0D2PA78_HYPSF|nr:hypothetical protein HYPSUDRAFT_1041185 [Hypholoma sublateritium FD-334 SS-4]